MICEECLGTGYSQAANGSDGLPYGPCARCKIEKPLQRKPPKEKEGLERQTYTIDEVAELLGLSRNSAYLAARTNRLPVAVVRIGKRMMVTRAALDRVLDR